MWIFAPDSVKRKGIISDFYLSFLLVSVGSWRMGLLLLQMFIKPKEGGDEEEICHDPRYRVAEADTRPCQGWYQPETHTASRNHFHYATQHRNLNFEF